VNVNAISNTLLEAAKSKTKLRIGTGELSDSLALDHILRFSRYIAPIVNKLYNIKFEFKTKSANVDNLLNMNPKNIIVSWSLNPPEISLEHERFAAPVEKRILAGKSCAEYGYRLAFHFDPVLYFEDYKRAYGTLLEKIFNNIGEYSVDFISISTFRGPRELLSAIRKRKKVPNFLRGDIIRGLDGKYRYFKTLRVEMLDFIVQNIKKAWPNVFIYLCMEHESLWQRFFGFDPCGRENFETFF
jgi:spore photoproduct lyase